MGSTSGGGEKPQRRYPSGDASFRAEGVAYCSMGGARWCGEGEREVEERER
jgi:hypothetical protein